MRPLLGHLDEIPHLLAACRPPEGEIRVGFRAATIQKQLGTDHFELLMMVGIAALFEGDIAAGATSLRRAIALAERSENPRRFVSQGSAAFTLETRTPPASRTLALPRMPAKRAAISALAFAPAMLAHSAVAPDRYSSARNSAPEGLRLAQGTGQENLVC